MFPTLVQKAVKSAASSVIIRPPMQRPEIAAIIHGDSLEELERLPPGCVDMIFADPPYLLSKGGTTMSGGRRVSVDKGEWDRGGGGVDQEHTFHRRWLRLCQRLLRPSGTIWVSGHYASIYSMGFAMQSLGYHVLNLITWEKPNPPGNLGCRQFTYSTEMIIWAAPAKVEPLAHVFNYDELKAENGDRQVKDVWRIAPPGPMEKRFGHHPTQKPEELLELCIRSCTKPGQLVLDPFSGSGTTGVVALRRGCDFIGVELSGEYVDLASRRIQADGTK